MADTTVAAPEQQTTAAPEESPAVEEQSTQQTEKISSNGAAEEAKEQTTNGSTDGAAATPAEEANKEQTNGSTEETKDNSHKEEATKVDTELAKKIVKQIEYYFGNFNLPRDKFLSAEVKKDDGWIEMETMQKFVRLSVLSTDTAVIVAALKGDADTFMEVHESGSKIRRSTEHPLPELAEDLQEESRKRTVYCKGFAKDGSVKLDHLLEFFNKYGDCDSVRMRNYVDKTSNAQGFKGSVLVVFKTEELANAFLVAPPVQYKKTYLIRKMYNDYLEEKRIEMEERKAKKLAKQSGGGHDLGEQGQKQFEEIGRGHFLRATGFAESTMREDIKAAVFDMTHDCGFVDFRKGEETAFIRFNEAGSNKQMLSVLEGNLTVNNAKVSLFLVEGEEEDAQLLKANEARRKSHAAGPYQKKRKMQGDRGNRGRGKRQRTH